MKQSAIDYLLKNYCMDEEERAVFDRLIKLGRNEELTVKTTPWINKMSVYVGGGSVEAFKLVGKTLYESTYRINHVLMEE